MYSSCFNLCFHGLSYQKLWLIAGYQEESFLGDKNKLAKLFGLFSYIVGIATFLLPFGLDFFGIISGIIYAVCICLDYAFVPYCYCYFICHLCIYELFGLLDSR